MGWASGSSVAEEIWKLVRVHIQGPTTRKAVARNLIEIFEGEDCDTIDEAEQLCKDAGRVYDEETMDIVYR